MKLEDESERLRTKTGAFVIIERSGILPLQDDLPIGGAIEEPDDVQEGCLPAPGGARQGAELSSFQCEIHSAKCLGYHTFTVGLVNATRGQEWRPIAPGFIHSESPPQGPCEMRFSRG